MEQNSQRSDQEGLAARAVRGPRQKGAEKKREEQRFRSQEAAA